MLNRQILFRGKRIDNGEWIEGDFRQDKDLETAYISGWNYYTDENGLQREPYEYEVDPSTICQYTGLTDKNGRKIFEGDIVNVDFKEGRIGAVEKTYPYTVKFNQRDTCFELMGNDELLGKPCLCAGNQFIMEVIGNIFDNPELIH